MGYIGDYTGEHYNRKPQTLNHIGMIKGDTRVYGSVGGMVSPAAGVLPKNWMHGQSLGVRVWRQRVTSNPSLECRS